MKLLEKLRKSSSVDNFEINNQSIPQDSIYDTSNLMNRDIKKNPKKLMISQNIPRKPLIRKKLDPLPKQPMPLPLQNPMSPLQTNKYKNLKSELDYNCRLSQT